jgi:hypothetical protein
LVWKIFDDLPSGERPHQIPRICPGGEWAPAGSGPDEQEQVGVWSGNRIDLLAHRRALARVEVVEALHVKEE